MAGIYLHIPFCKTRCSYCDFYSSTQSEMKERYLNALCSELELQKTYHDNEPIETIYFGGGTPSQLDAKDFKQLFSTIQRIYGTEQCTEITLEANPDDLTPEYLHALSLLPFNRISIGIQTFNDSTLRMLNRRHSAAQAIQAVKDARKAGFNNISIDLMYGLPNETVESWKEDIQQAIHLNVEHISAYHLIYEEGTPLHTLLQKHKVEEVDEESSVNFFALIIDELEKAGFTHYEISNFCREGKRSRHNSSYWTGKKYIGCGPSAHSYNGINRQWNVSSLHAYITGMEHGTPNVEVEELPLHTRYNDFIITSLRTCWGLSLEKLKQNYGEQLLSYCLSNAQPHLQNGKLKLENEHLYLTRQGIFISDGIMSDLLWVEE